MMAIEFPDLKDQRHLVAAYQSALDKATKLEVQAQHIERESQKEFEADKPIYIHFFIRDCDWFISEYDGEDLFFGYAIIGDPAFAEWGCISFTELKLIRITPGIEVDCELFDPPLKASEIREIRIR